MFCACFKSRVWETIGTIASISWIAGAALGYCLGLEQRGNFPPASLGAGIVAQDALAASGKDDLRR